ncbi:MAG: tripartite tricarboxylate transporter substrate binding protein, partial [Bosea sp. (in: a-proteobacteria)]|uniref:Bug family tripartite tricarboxylate transporter substrate binding protein n=1 Tax=Bosea sp. (in: a-proteobacteria) TaxID=1871050 RepID=UPI0027376261
RAPMFELSQLIPIARMTADPTVLVVRADSPWKTYAEFMAHAKANPGKVTFGSSGNYGTMHVPMEQLKASTGSYMLHVPYTGAGPAILGMLSGQVDAVATGPASAVGQIKAGKLRVVGVSSSKRLDNAPDAPTLKEGGVNLELMNWRSVVAPPGLSADQTKVLSEAIGKMVKSKEWAEILKARGWDDAYLGGADFDAFLKAEQTRVAKVMTDVGLVK